MNSLGAILGVAVLGFTIGGASGPLVAGGIFDATGSYEIAFLACVAIGIIGLVLITSLTPITGKRG